MTFSEMAAIERVSRTSFGYVDDRASRSSSFLSWINLRHSQSPAEEPAAVTVRANIGGRA